MPAEIIAGSVVSGITGLLGASAQRKAADRAAATSQRQYDLTRQDTALARSTGDDALAMLARLTGLPVQQRGLTVGSSPFNKADWDAISGVWGQIAPAARFEDINWNAVQGAQPISDEARGFLSSNWGNIRPAANLGDVDWNAFTHSGINYPTSQNADVPNTSPGGDDRWAGFFDSPDYDFVNQQGQRSIDRSLAARGKALSGEGVREGIKFAEGLATTNVNNYLNRLRGIAEIGQNAVSTTTGAGTVNAGIGANAAMAAGNARSSGYEAINNAVQGGLSNWLLMQELAKNRQPAPMYGG